MKTDEKYVPTPSNKDMIFMNVDDDPRIHQISVGEARVMNDNDFQRTVGEIKLGERTSSQSEPEIIQRMSDEDVEKRMDEYQETTINGEYFDDSVREKEATCRDKHMMNDMTPEIYDRRLYHNTVALR